MHEKKLTARQYLEQLQELDINISQDLERLADLKTSTCSTGAIDYSAERVQTSPSGDGLCCQVTNYVAFNEQINQEIDRLTDAKNLIIQQIRGLHNKYYIQILFKVYVQYKTVKQASAEMGKSYGFTIEQHNKALSAFEQEYKNLTYLT